MRFVFSSELLSILLVRDNDSVKHYRIRQGEDGRYYIARRTTFNTLHELVNHYSKTSDGLCVNLRQPCVHVSQHIHVIIIVSSN